MPRLKPPNHTRGVRIPDPLWEEFEQINVDRNETASEVVRALIEDYVAKRAPNSSKVLEP